MRGFDQILLNHFQACVHNSEFAIEVEAGHSSLDPTCRVLQVLASSQVIAGFAQQDYQAPLVLEPLGSNMMNIFDDADHSYDGRRKNPTTIRFVVEADVSSGHWCSKRSAGFSHAIDRLAELPHHFGPLR